jgi:hypothetical protein
MVHVGTVDAPVTVGDVKQIVAEFRKAVGTGKEAPKEQSVDILGWDFAFELNEIARQDAERAGIVCRSKIGFGFDLVLSGLQAACSYSLIRPLRTGFRRICHVPGSAAATRRPGSPSGMRWPMPWWGRAVL